jgi:hypothetical protein
MAALPVKCSWAAGGPLQGSSAGQGSAPADSCPCEQVRRRRPSVHLPAWGDRRSGRLPRRRAVIASHVLVRLTPNDVVYATRLPFDPGSFGDGCACRDRRASYVEGLWSPSLAIGRLNCTLKLTLYSVCNSNALRRVFLSQAGPRFGLEPVQAGHHLSSVTQFLSPKRRRRPLGSPSLGVCVRLVF